MRKACMAKNFKILLREIKDLNKWKIYVFMNYKAQYY